MAQFERICGDRARAFGAIFASISRLNKLPLQRISLILVRMAGTGARTRASRATKAVAAELTTVGPITMKSAVALTSSCGMGGNDTIRGLGGNDTLERMGGDDTLRGGG